MSERPGKSRSKRRERGCQWPQSVCGSLWCWEQVEEVTSVGGSGGCLRRQHAPIIACRVTELFAIAAIPNTSHRGSRARKWLAHTPKRLTSLLQATTSCASVCMPLLVRCISCRTFPCLGAKQSPQTKTLRKPRFFATSPHIY